MKKIKLLSLASLALLFVNCSNDDGDSNSNDVIDNNASEEVAIDITTVENGLMIEGAELRTGNIEPNGATSFEVDDKEISGFIDAGFELKIEVPLDYAGAYLQLQNEDGSLSTNYFDIPSNSFSAKSLKTNSKQLVFKSNDILSSSAQSGKSLIDDELTNTESIDVNFVEASIPAGTFCYSLCIYDTEGNISLPQTICVEVEAWGGNQDVVGSWTLVKTIDTYDGMTETFNVGEADCYENSRTPFNCLNEDGTEKVFIFDECDTVESLILNINSDGTQSYSFSDIETSHDWNKLNEECILEFFEYKTSITATGNWAYNEDEGILTIVDYDYDEITNDPDRDLANDDDEIGVGFDGFITQVSSSEMVLEFRNSYTDSSGVVTTETYEYFFTK